MFMVSFHLLILLKTFILKTYSAKSKFKIKTNSAFLKLFFLLYSALKIILCILSVITAHCEWLNVNWQLGYVWVDFIVKLANMYLLLAGHTSKQTQHELKQNINISAASFLRRVDDDARVPPSLISILCVHFFITSCLIGDTDKIFFTSPEQNSILLMQNLSS